MAKGTRNKMSSNGNLKSAKSWQISLQSAPNIFEFSGRGSTNHLGFFLVYLFWAKVFLNFLVTGGVTNRLMGLLGMFLAPPIQCLWGHPGLSRAQVTRTMTAQPLWLPCVADPSAGLSDVLCSTTRGLCMLCTTRRWQHRDPSSVQ